MTYKNKTITKHKRGNWYARVRLNGKLISVYGKTQMETYNRLKALADKVDNQKQKASNGRFKQRLDGLATQPITALIPTVTKAKKTYTLRSWFEEWLGSYKIGHVRAATIDGFKKHFKKINGLHNFKLTEITNLMLSKAINEVASVRAKDAVHNLIKQLFAVAFNNRLVETNPAANLPRPKQFAIREQKAFTAEQEKQFIDLCLADLPNCEPFLVALLQGLRRGEMLALRPDDFDFENDVLRIDESYDPYHRDDLQVKNDASNRKMPMFSLTKQVLLKYRGHNPTERIYAKQNEDRLYKSLDGLYEKSDLPRLTMHQLRHTFISRCHEKRIDEIIVQRWVGHAIGSRMTKAVYTHVSDDAERKYIEILNGKTA